MTEALNPWYNIVSGRHSSYRYKHLNLEVEDVSGTTSKTTLKSRIPRDIPHNPTKRIFS